MNDPFRCIAISMVMLIIIIISMFTMPVSSYVTTQKSPAPSSSIPTSSNDEDKTSSSKTSSKTTVKVALSEDRKCPVEITKEIIPRSKNGYIVGDNLTILVDIKCIDSDNEGNDGDIDYVQILEYVDPSLKKSAKLSECNFSFYILKDLHEMAKYLEGEPPNDLAYLNKIQVSDGEFANITGKGNNTCLIELKNLRNKRRILYWYPIKPERIGVFNTKTTLRISGDAPDVDVVQDVVVEGSNPQFKIDVEFNRLEIGSDNWYSTPKMPIKYNIQYLGGAPTPCICKIEVDPSEEYKIFNEETYNKTFAFELNEQDEFTINATYKSAGPRHLPGITIYSDNSSRGIPTEFNEYEITVSSWWDRNLNNVSFIISSLAFIISAVTYRNRNQKNAGGFISPQEPEQDDD